jgi:hypothetical protein
MPRSLAAAAQLPWFLATASRMRLLWKSSTNSRKDNLEEGFERIETDRVGAGKHEMFHRMLEELQDKYGG